MATQRGTEDRWSRLPSNWIIKGGLLEFRAGKTLGQSVAALKLLVAVLLLALGMIQRDGLVVIGGYVMMFGTMVYFTVLFWLAFRAGQLALGG